MQEETNVANRSSEADPLRAAFGREGCPVCTLALEAVQRSMESWQYEGFTDVENRYKLMRSKGFCPLHTWQLAQHSSGFQLALVYSGVLPDILDAIKLELEDATPQKGSQDRPGWLRWMPGQHQATPAYAEPAYELCPLCAVQQKAEQGIIMELLKALRAEEGQSLMRRSTGLCLLHFTQAHLEAEKSDAELLRLLLECQQVCVQRVLDEVQELIRKHDYRFSEEPRGNEMTSWRRAAELCAGNPGALR